jgi:hypothetical protein
MMRNKKWIAFPFVAAVLLLAAGGIVMLLWNAILPEVLSAKKLNYLQAIGLLALCRILFGGFGGGRGRGGPMGRMHRRPPSLEERERLKEMWRERCRNWKTRDGQD